MKMSFQPNITNEDLIEMILNWRTTVTNLKLLSFLLLQNQYCH